MGVITINNKLVSGSHNKWNSGFNGIYSAPGNNDSDATLLEKTDGIDYPDSRYYNLYPFPATAYPWFRRGGSFGSGSLAGVFGFNHGVGIAFSYESSRLVLAY